WRRAWFDLCSPGPTLSKNSPRAKKNRRGQPRRDRPNDNAHLSERRAFFGRRTRPPRLRSCHLLSTRYMSAQTIQLEPVPFVVSRERTGGAEAMKYAPALDGLRAVAILAVLGFHAMPGILKGGFTGVDVFFVLSGYLITSVILHDMRNGSFSIGEFYLRRIQRLL